MMNSGLTNILKLHISQKSLIRNVVSSGHESRNQREALKTLNVPTNMIRDAAEVIEYRSEASSMKVMK
uniref:Uncharacterized protein n=1 Tax=Glossina palpalis gambiensis TaxID=67801 RepID=A0A1B0BTJ3_9MUSC